MPPSSSSKGSPTKKSGGVEERIESSRTSTIKTPNDRRSTLARSPSGLSLSRPKSLLAPSKPAPLTPSVSTRQPNEGQSSNYLSVSPSGRSVIDRTHANGITASQSSTSVGNGNDDHTSSSYREGGALGRLKRVASNASLASSIQRFTSSPVPQASMKENQAQSDLNVGESSTSNAKSSVMNTDQSKITQSTDSAYINNQAETSKVTNVDDKIMIEEGKKRSLDVNNDPISEQKRNRRRTWFGFMGSEEESANTNSATDEEQSHLESQARKELKPDASSSTLLAPAIDKGSKNVESDDMDGQKTIRGPPSELGKIENQGTVKSWLPWRGQVNQNQEGSNDEINANTHEQPTSYTDSVRRYISWGSQNVSSSPVSTSNGGWGWPAWRSTSTNTQGEDGGASAASTSLATQQPQSNKLGDARAFELKPDRIQVPKQPLADSTPSTASPAQSSFIYRWVPTWSRGTAPSADELSTNSTKDEDRMDESSSSSPAPHKPPTTPAEQYKVEAMALLDAKGAILNPATRSTWINYFGSRSAAPSAKVPSQNIDEPEVMRIESGPASYSASPKIPSNSGKSTPITPSIHSKSDNAQSSVDSSNNGNRIELDKLRADPAPANSRPVTPLTNNKDVAKQQSTAAKRLSSLNAKTAKPVKPSAPNLLLPSFDDTFNEAPRSMTPKKGVWERTMSMIFNTSSSSTQHAKSRTRKSSILNPSSQLEQESKPGDAQARLPRLWSTMGEKERASSKGCKDVRKVTVIGIHGWFSQGMIRNLFGEPTGTSTKFASMMTEAVQKHFSEAGHTLREDQITSIALEADGQVSDRVNKSFSILISNPKWVKDLLTSDAIFVAAHSQGSIVATHLLARLVEQRHLDLRRSRITLLCMCGIHIGPFAHLRGSISGYYMNTFETPAAKELFEFQNGNSPVSKLYAASLKIVCSAGIKLVYIASLDDQVVPLYSALHQAASHPSILRGIFCDGAAFPRVDFLTNLLSFCVNVRNAGLGDHHLVTLLSSSVAGSLYGGLGHSLVYDEPQVYRLAVRYCLEVTSPAGYPTARPGQESSNSSSSKSVIQSNLPVGIPTLDLDDEFTIARNQKWNSNPYALPWSLRGLFEDESVQFYFSSQIDKLVRDYLDWQPSTKTLKDVQFRLEPMRFIATSNKNAQTTNPNGKGNEVARTSSGSTATPSNSKL